jgi:hypothetical protein
LAKLSNVLYKASKTARAVEVVSSGNPERIGKYLFNKIVGKTVARLTRGLFLK